MALRPRLSPGVPFRLSLRVNNITNKSSEPYTWFSNKGQAMVSQGTALAEGLHVIGPARLFPPAFRRLQPIA
jgi:hypothetical protein